MEEGVSGNVTGTWKVVNVCEELSECRQVTLLPCGPSACSAVHSLEEGAVVNK